MCTVSYIPVGHTAFLTSNRDEQTGRLSASLPEAVNYSSGRMLYPVDGKAGGTWIACHENGNAMVLLNGAFFRHEPAPQYRKSRGLMFLEIFNDTSPSKEFLSVDLTRIEPFTLVIAEGKNLWEARWDGTEKFLNKKDVTVPHIWSSVTLYEASVQQKRETWFYEWLRKYPQPSLQEIRAFHRFAGDGDAANDLRMSRNGVLQTLSITSISISQEHVSMHYSDLLAGLTSVHDWPLAAICFIMRKLIRKHPFFIRLLHWEYWNSRIIYAPVYPYWIWLSIKARSFFFLTAANPRIRNGGFIMESKMTVYQQLPEDMFPATALLPPHASPAATAKAFEDTGLAFPIIVKPDYGERGLGVKKIKDLPSLIDYAAKMPVPFLVQAFVPHPHEAGIFFVKLPGESRGRITGIVNKQPVAVTGDGIRTLEQLVFNEPRYILQWPFIQKEYNSRLSEVLVNGERLILVPYGNHCRGSLFTDETHRLSPGLEATLLNICNSIPEFNFGRLDILF